MIIHRRKKRIFLTYWVGLNIAIILVMAVAFLVENVLPSASYIIGINVLLIAMTVARNGLKTFKISNDEQEIIIEIERWFFIIDTYKVNKSEVDISLEKESEGRLGKRDVLRIYIDQELLVNVVPGYSGWEKNDLELLVNDFNRIAP
jgi:hypothetical protein